jgi:PAS domain S-box-containing protein
MEGGRGMEKARHRILLVEDDKVDQTAFERLVQAEELPYDYVIAGSRAQARSILGSEQFDAVICDYMLGDGTAFDVLEVVKNAPFIVVTGTGSEEIAVKAWRAGACDYLIKDIERRYLKALPITVENALRHKDTEEKLRLLSGAIMSTDDSVHITDLQGKIIFVNKAFCETYGYRKEEVLGKDSSLLWIGSHQNINTRSVFQTQIMGGPWTVGFYHRRKDGSIFPVSLSRSIIKDAGGNKIAVVASARDITEHILVEDELRRVNRKLEQQNQQQSKLAVMVAGALKRLLTGENIDNAQQTSQDICERLDQARKIVAGFLDITEIDAGRMKLESTKFDLQLVISEVVQALSQQAAEKGIELKTLIPESKLAIDGDRRRIGQALANLISHSISSVPANGHIEVSVKDNDHEVTIEMHHDGPSIGHTKMDNIFDRFQWMEDQVHLEQEEGVDLSLLAARELIELHGGKIWIEPRDEGRNNLCISLPKVAVQPQVVVAAKETERQ